VVYSRNIDGQTYTFGVSGRLYKSNVLLYDHQTESLWSQLMHKAIAGPMVNKKLDRISSRRTSWKSWRKKHPQTLVLSTDTGYMKDYSRDPYEGYYRVGRIWFPVGKVRKDLSPKEMVIGLEINGRSRAYPVSLLQKSPGILKDTLNGTTVLIEVQEDGEISKVTDGQGNPIHHVFSYWFAWQAFNADTSVYGK
jgi:hypothetical protein